MERLLTYGLLNGVLHHIYEVANGLSCGCICAHCRQPLVAKNGLLNSRVAHFAHQSGTECAGAYETTLHLLAKQVFLKNKRLALPPFHFDYNPLNKNSLFKKSSAVVFEAVVLEQKSGAPDAVLIPDAIGTIKGKEIFIEFAHTHFIDRSKKAKLIRWAKPCVEINISTQVLDEKALQAFFDTPDHKNKYWIYNPRLEAAYKEVKTKRHTEKRLHQQQKAALSLQAEKEKLQHFQQMGSNRVLLATADGKIDCPNKWNNLQPLKATRYYAHKVLKSIIDGAAWDQVIHGQYALGKWIFLNEAKIIIFPPDAEWQQLGKEAHYNARLLYAGLVKIKEMLQCQLFLHCSHCPYAVVDIALPGAYYKVCRFPLQEVS